MTAADRYNPERFRIPFSAEVAKSVDAVDSKSTVEIRAGSSPAFGTIGTSIDVNGRLFFVSEIQYPQGFPRFFTQPKSTRFNLHQLTDAGTTAGISRFDNVCTHTEPLKGYSSWL